jgi:hypothetical protein
VFNIVHAELNLRITAEIICEKKGLDAKSSSIFVA